jgi:hypothetical protein
MKVRELNIGDVFRVAGGKQLWCKSSRTRACRIKQGGKHGTDTGLTNFRGKELELVERAAEICRVGNTLVLRDGEVTLDYCYPVLVHRCTPGNPFTELVLAGQSFPASRARRPTERTALMFTVGAGVKHLNRAAGSDLLAYGGRVYIRATFKEVTGKAKGYGYRRSLTIDGARRMVIMGALGLPGEFALYDIMMEHFGPDTVPRT